jgi:hypothetical protein
LPRTERTHSVSIEIDELVDLSGLEEAVVAFARTAPAELLARAVEAMTAGLIDAVVGPHGSPRPASEQLEAPWSCTRCGSRRGFRRRGRRGRQVTCAVGRTRFALAHLECLSCRRRFVPGTQVLGLRPHQRTTDALVELGTALATEVAYAKAARLLQDLSGIAISARQVRRGVLAVAPERLGPEELDVPVVLLDGTGVRAGQAKAGVGLHLAIGLVARERRGGRVSVQARLLGATVGESWDVMRELLAPVRPGLVVVDGEEDLSGLVAELWSGVPVQRCMFHLTRAVEHLCRYRDHLSLEEARALRDAFTALVTDAYRSADLPGTDRAYDEFVERLVRAGAPTAATHLRLAKRQALTFLTHPGAGRLVFGHKGRPELATSVLERVMREMNRRTDVGVRWSLHGARALLMAKLGRKYDHGRWSPRPAPTHPPAVRFTLSA